MRCFIARMLYPAGVAAAFSLWGLASPLDGKLLPLVPPGCAIVAGFENGHGPHSGGRLLLTTPNNQLDLDDWLALAGVDTSRRYDEVIEAAAPNSAGELTAHLLLVGGRFDRERIFRAAQQNGAQTAQYQGETVLILKPFPREQRVMSEIRWLVILKNRIALLGTPLLVQEGLSRYTGHAGVDSSLAAQLNRLKPDIGSWNVLVSARKLAPNSNLAKPHSVWARLLDDADVVTVGAHFGSRIRVDFSVQTSGKQEPAYFTHKAALFSDTFAPMTRASDLTPQPRPSVEDLFVEKDQIRGSILLSGRQFDDWIAHLGHAEPAQGKERPTTIAETH